jgi:hypothetical protein
MKLPHRHGLIPSSCVNNEALKFNRQVEKKMKICNNVKMLETDLDIKYFTKHDQHLNLPGKELIYCIWNYQKVMTVGWESLHDRILEPFFYESNTPGISVDCA